MRILIFDSAVHSHDCAIEINSFMDRGPQTFIPTPEINVIMDKTSSLRKKSSHSIKHRTDLCSVCNTIHIMLLGNCYKGHLGLEKLQREQTETIHLEKQFCDSY